MSTTVNVQEAKTHLSRLLASLSANDDIIIANRGVPVARLSAFQEENKRPLGFLKGTLPESFFNALPEEELREWEHG
jgi:antitoxin (DNA-binding transcriptional repressor) of toxin-antitoxin stability system